jgi:hypothetical protein
MIKGLTSLRYLQQFAINTSAHWGIYHIYFKYTDRRMSKFIIYAIDQNAIKTFGGRTTNS